mmetsp:Transcript_42162/g.126251  ORF Transcript_42162/g.126251 Transcript_42162/m.126251 type:complete len:209 (+) Transcript_42162:1584-2210(+)
MYSTLSGPAACSASSIARWATSTALEYRPAASSIWAAFSSTGTRSAPRALEVSASKTALSTIDSLSCRLSCVAPTLSVISMRMRSRSSSCVARALTTSNVLNTSFSVSTETTGMSSSRPGTPLASSVCQTSNRHQMRVSTVQLASKHSRVRSVAATTLARLITSSFSKTPLSSYGCCGMAMISSQTSMSVHVLTPSLPPTAACSPFAC